VAEIRAELAGNVWKVQASQGDVLPGETVIIVLESMKMEIPIIAGPGVVQEMRVAEGGTVLEGQVLAVIVETSP
jgi:acetyl-CoA carboxylase biotin carboxyl carrier protein